MDYVLLNDKLLNSSLSQPLGSQLIASCGGCPSRAMVLFLLAHCLLLPLLSVEVFYLVKCY